MSARPALRPVNLTDAKRWVGTHHRHNLPPVSWKFGTSVVADGDTVGVGMAGRPVGRGLDDGYTLEIIRVTTPTEGARPNVCSMLYGALCRAGKALGYRRAYTYKLASEDGASLKASGFVLDAVLAPRATWDTPSRPRVQQDLFGEDRRPTEAKERWRRDLYEAP